MSRIDPQLFSKLMARLGVGDKAVYRQIQTIATKRRLPNHLAAIELAADNGISIQRFLNKLPDQDAAKLNNAGYGVPSASSTSDAATRQRNQPAQTLRQKARPVRKTKENSVFVVHGRNTVLRDSMFDFLGALGLTPLEWSEALLLAKGPNPSIEKILDKALEKAEAILVLFSPDDEVRLLPEYCTSAADRKTEGKYQAQARPNVLFEAGLALGGHPAKTLMVQVGRVKPFSDIGGKHLVHLTDDVAKRKDVALRLKKIGCAVNLTGDRWMTAGTFKINLPRKAGRA